MASLAPGKKPLQQRSKNRIRLIIEATKELLREHTIDQITTNRIARESGVNVATLYQYFPNKQSIVYSIYEEWLNQILEGYDEIEQQYFLKEDWKTFFARLPSQRYRSGFEFSIEVNLDCMMASNHDLTEIDHIHSQKIADRFVRYLKGYGSNWDEEKLNNLAFLLYELIFSAVYRFTSQTPEERLQTEDWACISYLALIEHSLAE